MFSIRITCCVVFISSSSLSKFKSALGFLTSIRNSRAQVPITQFLNDKNHPMTRSLNHQLLEPYAIVVVPARHVREDDLIAFLQSTENFHGVYRATSELYLDTICILAVRLELKHTDRAFF